MFKCKEKQSLKEYTPELRKSYKFVGECSPAVSDIIFKFYGRLSNFGLSPARNERYDILRHATTKIKTIQNQYVTVF